MIKAHGVNIDFQELILTHKERQEVINNLFQNETKFQKKINLLCQIPELNWVMKAVLTSIGIGVIIGIALTFIILKVVFFQTI